MSTQTKTVCFVAGRSGGHLIPCITLAHQAKKEFPDRDLILFSTDSTMDKTVIDGENPFTTWIPLRLDNVPYAKPYLLPIFAWRFVAGFCKSLYYLYRTKPAKVISMGGYISLPVCFAAWLLRIPIELFEVNVLPGRAVSMLAPLAQRILICFERTKKYLPKDCKCVVTDYPIRFGDEVRTVARDVALRNLGLDPHKKTLFIVCGSQGSVFINNALKNWLVYTPEAHSMLNIIHQTGTTDTTNWPEFYRAHNIPAITFAFSHNLSNYYAAADLIICRAGAGTLFEIGFFNKQCITIPLATDQNDHQRYNGKMIAKMWPDLVTVIEQADVAKDPQELYEEIHKQLFAQAPHITHTTHRTTAQ